MSVPAVVLTADYYTAPAWWSLHERLCCQYGAQRARRILNGKDLATNRDLELWAKFKQWERRA